MFRLIADYPLIMNDMKKILFLALAATLCAACAKKSNSQNQQNTMTNPTIETIMTRVSVREFTGEKISAEQIDMLLRAAMAAPSAINRQPWAFIVVTDDDIIGKLGEALPFSRCSNHPACAIIPCGDLSKAIEGEMGAFWINDVSAATENLLLAIASGKVTHFRTMSSHKCNRCSGCPNISSRCASCR